PQLNWPRQSFVMKTAHNRMMRLRSKRRGVCCEKAYSFSTVCLLAVAIHIWLNTDISDGQSE
ncbi:hypothetical protein QVM87_21550, partial [Providencia stuartii]|nr:hypothetical protein [Providencia stuartii]